MNLETLLIPLKFDIQGIKDSLGEAKSAIQGDLAGLGSSITSAGQNMMGATTAIVGGFTAAVVATQDWAGTVDSLGDVLGTSADDSATLAYAIQRVGGDTTALTGQMAYMVKGLTSASGGLGTTGKALDSLGISATDANGNIKPAKDLLLEVSDVVGNMPDGLEKTKIMTDLFGKSGKDLSDTLGALANDGFEQANEKAREMGLLMGDEGVNKSIEFGKAMEDLKMSTQGLAVSFGTALLPAIQPIIEAIGKLIQWFTQLDPGIKTAIVSILGIVAALAPLLIIVGQVVSAVSTIAGIFGGLGGVVTAVGGALSAAGAALTAIIPVIGSVVAAAAPVILVIAAIAAAIALLYLGWKNNWFGIRDTINLVVGDIKTNITNTWTSFTDAIKNLWSDMWDKIKESVSNAWSDVKSGFSNLVDNIKNFLSNVNWKELGKNIIRGIGEGISSMLSWIRQKAQEIADSITDAIKDALGISSPSQVMKVEVGYNMAGGVIEGYEELMNKFNPAMSMTVNSLVTPNDRTQTAALLSAVSGLSTKSADFDYNRFGRSVRDAVLMATG